MHNASTVVLPASGKIRWQLLLNPNPTIVLNNASTNSGGGTGIRGLMRGMATLLQGNQEPLVVRDEVGRPRGELGVSKSVGCDIFPSVL